MKNRAEVLAMLNSDCPPGVPQVTSFPLNTPFMVRGTPRTVTPTQEGGYVLDAAVVTAESAAAPEAA